MAHFPPLLTLPKIQNDVSVWSKIESSAQPKKTISIYQINRTDSARVFYQTTKFDKQQTSTFCLLSRPYARLYNPKSYRRQGSSDQNWWVERKVRVYDHG